MCIRDSFSYSGTYEGSGNSLENRFGAVDWGNVDMADDDPAEDDTPAALAALKLDAHAKGDPW